MKKAKLFSLVLGGMMVLGMASTSMAAVPVPTYDEVAAKMQGINGTVFPIGSYNEKYAPYFTGQTFLAPLAKDVPVSNVTFIDGAHTFWHVHHGTCQILVGVSGHGYYQIWGQKPQKLEPGMTVTIPEGTKHWHGAAPGQMFQHIAIMEPKQASTEWMEPVNQKDYEKLGDKSNH